MEHVVVSNIVLIVSVLGIILVLLAVFGGKKSYGTSHVDKELEQIFFQQHMFLLTHKNELFAFDKVKELVFYNKKKFFATNITPQTKRAYLHLGKSDMQYLEGLLHKQ